MADLLDFVPIMTTFVFAGILTASLLQFSTIKKNMRIQTEQQIYSRIMDARLKLENTEAFTQMAKESRNFNQRFKLVDRPEEYYTITAFLDLFEYIFRLYRKRLIDHLLWERWKKLAILIMSIPKFKLVWNETKHSHTQEFIRFFDSIESESND